MSRTLTRSPLQSIAMNGAGTQKRRSARLSNEGAEDSEPPVKKARMGGANGGTTNTIAVKSQDGDSNALSKKKWVGAETVDNFTFRRRTGGRRGKEPEQAAAAPPTPELEPPAPEPAPVPVPVREDPKSAKTAKLLPTDAARRTTKVFSENVGDFTFNRGGRGRRAAKDAPHPVVQNSTSEEQDTAKSAPEPPAVAAPTPAPKRASTPPFGTVHKKPRRQLPSTPEPPKRRSKRLSNEHATDADPQPSPHRAAHTKSHQNHDRSPSPEVKARPVTVGKTRRNLPLEEEKPEKTMRIHLPFQDTPVIRRNQEMRKESAETHRRSSTGLRGRRASSLIDEGRGNALPHAEVSTTDFFKHISADLTEPRRMRCLLGWCGTRSLPAKPEAPKDNSPASSLQFSSAQAARAILEELAIDLVSKDSLSNWFARDEQAPPQIPLRKKSNPRNITNAIKAEELEKELERLKKEKSEWDSLIISAAAPSSPPAKSDAERISEADYQGSLSPIYPTLLDTPQRVIFEQLHSSTLAPTNPEAIQQRLQNVAENLEFTVDQFVHGVHTLSATKETAERVAERTLAEAATVLEEREKARGKGVDTLDALRALGKVLNGKGR